MAKNKKRKLDVPKRVPRVIPTVEEAAEGRDQGMGEAEAHSGPEWAAIADDFIEHHLRVHEQLFADSLWFHGLPVPVSLRALGPRFSMALKNEYMETTGQYRRSVSSHLSARPVWRSLIYEGEAHCADG